MEFLGATAGPITHERSNLKTHGDEACWQCFHAALNQSLCAWNNLWLHNDSFKMTRGQILKRLKVA